MNEIINVDLQGNLVEQTTTVNYQLEKPYEDDFYDVIVHNRNMDKLDLEVHEQGKQIKDCFGRLLEVENQVGNIDVSWSGIKEKPTVFPPSEHNHPASQITGLPTSYPANGGNANTVGGMQPWQLATLNAAGESHGTSHPAIVQHNAFGDGRFAMLVSGHETRVNHSSTSDNANNATYTQGRNLCAEFDVFRSAGSIKSVQRGCMETVNVGSSVTSQVVNIGYVNPAKCLVSVDGYMGASSSTHPNLAILKSMTSTSLTIGTTGNVGISNRYSVSWEVVEFN